VLKTIEIVDSNDEPKEIYSVTTICSNRKGSEKIKRTDYLQADIMFEFAQEDQLEPDNEEDDDEIDQYVKAKLIFKSDESVLNW
jgi:hypothetical protein